MTLLSEIVQDVAPVLKAIGYKKKGMTWRKEKDKMTIIFSVQKSQYSMATWYYNFGIALSDLIEKNVVTISDCHIRFRCENIIDGMMLTAVNIGELIKKWEKMYGTLPRLRSYAIEGRLPIQTSAIAIRYLTSVDLSSTGDGLREP